MGWRDNRKSHKMRRRTALRKHKDRIKRRRERMREERAAAQAAPAQGA
jgi:hypothetical protein